MAKLMFLQLRSNFNQINWKLFRKFCYGLKMSIMVSNFNLSYLTKLLPYVLFGMFLTLEELTKSADLSKLLVLIS